MKVVNISIIIFNILIFQSQFSELKSSIPTYNKKTPESILQIDQINKIAYNLRQTDVDSSKNLVNNALEFSQKLDYKKGIADANLTIGIHLMNSGELVEAVKKTELALGIYYQLLYTQSNTKTENQISLSINILAEIHRLRGNYTKAMELNKKALAIRIKTGDKTGIASSLNNMGLLFRQMGNYPEALNYYLLSLKVSETQSEKRGIFSALNNIGIIYDDQQNYREALKCYLQAYKTIVEINDLKAISDVTNNIGVTYSNMGMIENSITYLNKALELSIKTNNQHLTASVYSNIGNNYWQSGEYEKAILQFENALEIFEKIGDLNGQTGTLLNLGSVYGESNQLLQAEMYLEKAMKYLSKLNNREFEMEIYRSMATLEEIKGNYKKTFEYFQLYTNMKDSLFNEVNTRNLVKTQLKHDYEKKETLAIAEQKNKDILANKEIQRQKLFRNFLLTGFVSVLAFAFIFFVQRNKIKKAKERSDELLLNILPAEVAEELKEKGFAESKLIEEVTVLFTDFRNFTQLAEILSPRDLVDEINNCFSTFDHIVERHGIEKIKTIGDAYMAAGGLPNPNNTHALDVTQAALEIIQFIENRKNEKITSGQPYLEIRIGIHSGPVVAGIVGVKKFQYDIWGDTVNTASRMESNGEAGKVNLSENTYRLLSSYTGLSFQNRGETDVKGKGKMKMFFVEYNKNHLF